MELGSYFKRSFLTLGKSVNVTMEMCSEVDDESFLMHNTK
jgi:hypothetical protein